MRCNYLHITSDNLVLVKYAFTLLMTWIIVKPSMGNHIHKKCGMKLRIHSQTSAVQALKFEMVK